MKNIYNSLLPKIALFSASLIWGTSFIVMKNAVGVFPTHILIALRFTFGCILLSLIFMKKLKKLNYQYILSGGIIGIFLFLAYSMQTIGLNYTTPGKNAFLTAVYCVIVPFMYWIVDKTKPDKYNISAAIVCIIGVGLVSLNGDLSMGIGDIFTL
ncbi:MAG: DMT family transporter, partial [Clostridiales bacterium]|nr:DMT family transporter [Clostridiales bacterium]